MLERFSTCGNSFLSYCEDPVELHIYREVADIQLFPSVIYTEQL